MIIDPQAIALSESDESEVIDTISKAFFETPHINALVDKPEHTRAIIMNLINLYKGSGAIKMFGIKKYNKLVCIGVCIDSNSKPGFIKLTKFGFSLLKTLGFEGVKQFWKCDKNKPKYDKICLELMLFGTLPSFQKKGFGRKMLNSLYDFAKKNNYNGVTCVVNSSRPAFKFYRKEGWIVDKAFYIGDYHFCWMRHVV